MIWKRKSIRAGDAFSRKGLELGVSESDLKRILNHASAVGLEPDVNLFESRQLFSNWVEKILSERNPLLEDRREEDIVVVLRRVREELGLFAAKRNDRIWSSRELREGQQLFFSRAMEGRPAVAGTSILESNESRFVVREPRRDRIVLDMGEKDAARVKFSFKDTGYQFETDILAQIKEPRDTIWELRHVNEIVKLYERRYPRIELKQEVEFWMIPRGKFYQFNEMTRYRAGSPYKLVRGLLLDISERGLALSSPAGISRNDFVYLDFSPVQGGGGESIPLIGEVVNHVILSEDSHIISTRIPGTISSEARARLNQFIRGRLGSEPT